MPTTSTPLALPTYRVRERLLGFDGCLAMAERVKMRSGASALAAYIACRSADWDEERAVALAPLIDSTCSKTNAWIDDNAQS